MTHLQHQNEGNEPRDWVTRNITIENCSYQVRYSPSQELVEVTQEPRVIMGYRKSIGTHYKEICSYKGVGIETEIARLLIMERPRGQGPLVDGEGDAIGIPKCLTTVKEVQLEDSSFTIAYDWDTDLIVIHIPQIVTRKHRNTLEVGQNELRNLNKGLFMSELLMLLFEIECELEFNPENDF